MKVRNVNYILAVGRNGARGGPLTCPGLPREIAPAQLFTLLRTHARSLAEPRLLTGSNCSREMFDYVIRSKRVGVRAESLSMFSSEKRLRTDITSTLKILLIKKREYRDSIKRRETRPGWGEAHNVYKACVGIYHGGVLSQYVHIGYITQALYCLLHRHILHCDGV